MGVQIYTYEHVNDLLYNPEFPGELKNAIHITATSSLKSGIMNSISNGNRWLDSPILSFGQLVPFIGYDWFSSKTELLQYTTLSKSMRTFVENSSSKFNERIFQAIDKNQTYILRTIRTLMDSGITLEDARKSLGDDVTDEEKVTFELWRDLEKTKSFESYQKWFAKFEDNPLVTFKAVIEQALDKVAESEETRANANLLPHSDMGKYLNECLDRTFQPKKGLIVFHGFYFLTPVQKRILDRLAEEEGFQVVHLIQYNQHYKETFKTVETFLDFDKYNYTAIPKKSFPVNYIAKKFIKMVEGDFEDNTDTLQTFTEGSDDGSLLEFNHMYQFKNYLQHYPDDLVVSPRASTVRKYTEDLISSSDADLKDYPIGQFLIDIHRLNKRTFKPEEVEYQESDQLEYSLLLKIFNSDYLMIGEESAKRYFSALQKIAPVMQKCKTLEEWMSNIQRLIEQKKALEKTFEGPFLKTGIEHELYNYPNRFLSYFNVTITDLEKIQEGIICIKDFYEKLYIGTSTSIANYIEELQGYMTHNIQAKKTGEEQRIVQKVINQLDNLKEEEFSGIERSDLILGLQYFLATSTKQDSDLGEKIDSGRTISSDAVLGLQDADKLPFMQNRYVHLAFMDNKALPMNQNLSLWPFKRPSIDNLENIEKRGGFLKQIRLRKELSASITAYLIFVLLQRATKAKFSIVKNFEEEHNLTTSFYIELLNLKKGFTEVDVDLEEYNNQYSSEQSLKTITFNRRANTMLLNHTKTYCKKRFTLSYLLQDRVDFNSDFHNTFLYRNYLQIYYLMIDKQKGISEQEVNAFIDSWFPQWHPLKKDMLRENAKKYIYSDVGRRNTLREVTYDGMSYADNYKRIALFGNNAPYSTKFANPGEHCKYCPFQLHCKESVNNDE